MRDNVNTNFGGRLQSLAKLEKLSGQDIRPMLAGQSAKSFMPTGIQGGTLPLTTIGSYSVGGLPGVAVQTSAQSPKLVALGAHSLGRITCGAQDIRQAVPISPTGVRGLMQMLNELSGYESAIENYQQ